MATFPILVLMDTDRIQSYIFSTNKLKEISGASALLDKLNLQEIPKQIVAKFPKNNLIHPSRSNDQFKIDLTLSETVMEILDCYVFAFGGGAIRMGVKDEFEEKAHEFIAEVSRLYLAESGGGARITGIVVSRRSGESDKALMLRAETLLQARKRNRSVISQPFANPYFKSCESSGIGPAIECESEPGGQKSYQSLATKKKRDNRDGTYSYFSRFSEYLKVKGNTKIGNKNAPDSLNEIGEASTPKGYIGLIFADANRMGWRLQNQFETFEQIASFSEMIKTETEKTLYSALENNLDFFYDYFPFQIFLIGGDDILLAVPAGKALDLALSFASQFEQATEYSDFRGEKTRVSLGTGIVIAHANHPLHRMIKLAQDLAKSAKSKSLEKFDTSGKKDETSYFNFLVAKGAHIRDWHDIQEQEMSYEDYLGSKRLSVQLYHRPYSTEELQDAIFRIRELKSAKTPRSKLMQLYQGLRTGVGNGTMASLMIASRLPEKSRRALLLPFVNQDKKFPWWNIRRTSYDTPLIDWIELYDFVNE